MGRDPYFNPQDLPDPRIESVAWLDLMGTASIMKWSTIVSATNICKLLVAAIEADKPEDMNIYPVMDGVYITHNSGEELSSVFIDIFSRFATVLRNRYEKKMDPDDPEDSFLRFAPVIKGGAARGEVYHSSDVQHEKISDHPFSDRLVFGEPVATAHLCERESPPFGFKLDQTIEDEDAGRVVEWWVDDESGRTVKNALIEYYNMFYDNGLEPMTNDTIERHIGEIVQYFPNEN